MAQVFFQSSPLPRDLDSAPRTITGCFSHWRPACSSSCLTNHAAGRHDYVAGPVVWPRFASAGVPSQRHKCSSLLPAEQREFGITSQRIAAVAFDWDLSEIAASTASMRAFPSAKSSRPRLRSVLIMVMLARGAFMFALDFGSACCCNDSTQAPFPQRRLWRCRGSFALVVRLLSPPTHGTLFDAGKTLEPKRRRWRSTTITLENEAPNPPPHAPRNPSHRTSTSTEPKNEPRSKTNVVRSSSENVSSAFAQSRDRFETEDNPRAGNHPQPIGKPPRRIHNLLNQTLSSSHNVAC